MNKKKGGGGYQVQAGAKLWVGLGVHRATQMDS